MKLLRQPFTSSSSLRTIAQPVTRLPVCSAVGGEHQQAGSATRRSVLGVGVAMGMASSRQRVATAATPPTTSPVEQVLLDPKWPEKWPFRPQDFGRYDEQADTLFYSEPRFVTHIDDYAIGAVTKYYGTILPPNGTGAVLDMCSSWVSHYPDGYKAARAVGLGMNAEELKRNPQLTEWVVRDLNENPALPFDDNSFDVITNTVSVDYLNKPMEIFKEMHRVLKPGGIAAMTFSNRCFPTKAIQLWTMTGDLDHIWIVGSYFHYSVPGGFTEPRALDLSPKLPTRTDPMYVVFARKA